MKVSSILAKWVLYNYLRGRSCMCLGLVPTLICTFVGLHADFQA